MQSHGVVKIIWCSQWVPRLPINVRAITRQYCRNICSCTVQCDVFFEADRWEQLDMVSPFVPTEKSPRMQWRRHNVPRTKKSKPQASAVKIMLTVFSDTEGPQCFFGLQITQRHDQCTLLMSNSSKSCVTSCTQPDLAAVWLWRLWNVTESLQRPLDDDGQDSVVQYFRQQPKKLLADGICWPMQCDTCLNACGDVLLTAAVPSPVSIL